MRADNVSALKNPTASAGFEPLNLGSKGQHATPRTPKPLPYQLLIILHTSSTGEEKGREQSCESALWNYKEARDSFKMDVLNNIDLVQSCKKATLTEMYLNETLKFRIGHDSADGIDYTRFLTVLLSNPSRD